MRRRCPAGRWPLLVALIASTLSPQAPAPGGEPPPSTPENLEQLQAEIAKILEAERVPGAGVALVDRDAVLWAGGVGSAALADEAHPAVEVTADTAFRVGSVSKSFIAAALMTLVEEGRLGLDTRLSELVPEIEFGNPWESTHPLRLVHLLEHSAGFDDMHFTELYNLAGPPEMPLRQALALSSRSRVARWPPASRFSYSNPGYALAGYVLEKASGQPFDEAVRERVLSPLGMSRSDCRLTPEVAETLAQGYEGPDRRPVPYSQICLRPAGSLHSTPREMATFVSMLLGRGRLGDVQLLRPETVERMEHPVSVLAARAGVREGYGLGIFTSFREGFLVRGHDGGIDGFLSSYGYLPEQGVGYVLLLNSLAGGKAVDEIANLLVRYLTRGLSRPTAESAELPAEVLASYRGTFRDGNPRNQLFAFIETVLSVGRLASSDGTLRYSPAVGESFSLVPTAPGLFRGEKHTTTTWALTRDETGRRVLARGAGLYLEEVSAFSAYAPLMASIAALVLVLSPFAVAIGWLWPRRFRRLRASGGLKLRALVWATSLSLVLAIVLFSRLDSQELGVPNWKSWGFAVLTTLFATGAAVGLLLALRRWRCPEGRWGRFYLLAATLAQTGLAAYLAAWGIIGFRTWTY